MDKLANSPAEVLKTIQIKPIEQECLDRVFKFLTSQDQTKPSSHANKISVMDLAKTLLFLGQHPTKNQIKQMVWEVDDDLDGYVSETEYITMYKRCISDQTELEPRTLFNLVQFLMYDKTFRGKVTVEETLQILFVRYGRHRLDDEIKAIFGDEEKNADGSDKQITFGEYVKKINIRALQLQKDYMRQKLAAIRPPTPDADD